MPYIVTNSDGTLTVTVSDNTVDTASYSLALVGRSVSNYGQYFAQNTIRHLENFASATAPSTPITGQLWYDKTEKVIRAYDGVYWKRMGTVVGANNQKPTTQLAGGGTSFFNTTNNKLEVHNGANWKEAAYGGEVTSAYSANTDVDSPTFYGTRLRTLFLNGTPNDADFGLGTDPRPYPVLALMHVKTSSNGTPRRGITLVGSSGQYETIMALWSDYNFTISSDTATPVEGDVVNFYSELTGTGGIASARSGRTLGVILQGQNTRAEYEDSDVIRAEQIYADNLGSDGVRGNGYFDVLDVVGFFQANSLSVSNDITANGSIIAEGDITAAGGVATFANLVVTADSTLTNITANGSIIAEGDITAAEGTATFANLVVTADSTLTSITTGSAVTAGTITGAWTLTSGSSFQSTYADLGEKYIADAEYAGGTVVKLGGSAEITRTTTDADTEVFGVISTDPAYIMNAGADGPVVALSGRVPVRVVGTVSKGERLVTSSVEGTARAIGNTPYDPRLIVGRALEHKTDDGIGTIEAVIGVN